MPLLSASRSLLLIVLLLTSVVRGAEFARARLDGLTRTGDVMAYVLPATALGLTAYHRDGAGAWQLGQSAAIGMATTFALKYTVNARRPNGDPYSFPSGHATMAFASAEFMRVRYGWKFGLPAYLFASFVGYSRVHANLHYYRDVIVGAAIGVASSFLTTTSFAGRTIRPELGEGFRRLQFSTAY
jgi:membrane-associated phospholipid phosphatase